MRFVTESPIDNLACMGYNAEHILIKTWLLHEDSINDVI